MTNPMPLLEVTRRLIKKTGPMPVWRYMELCLAHPQYGYYVGRDPLGRDGDFTTSPEISQMFGELLGLWVASVWRTMRSPQVLRLIELGPGRGTMMADALRAMRVLPPLYQAIDVHLVEISPVLREKQRAALSGVRRIEWHDTLDDVPPGPCIILANEYLDALPVHQMVRRETGWHERTVELTDDNRLRYGVAAEPTPRFDSLLPKLGKVAPIGAIFEWRADANAMTLARRVADNGGAALVIDYGHIKSDIGDTLQAVQKQAYADPLAAPGHADITAHVDFEAVARAAEDAGAAVHGPITQGEFLRRLGIDTRAQTLTSQATASVAADINVAVERLTASGTDAMGSLFKVIGLADPVLGALAGFSDDAPSAT